MEWKPDRGLQVRMVATLCLVVLFAVAIPATLWLLLTQGARLVALVLGTSPAAVLVVVGLTAVAIISGFYFIEWYASNDLTDYPVDEEEETEPTTAEVPNEVETRATKIASQLSVPRPNIECRASNVPTAFTTGYSPESATIVVTTALVETLDADELEAVLAHEFAHIRHRDFLVVTLASIPLRLALRVRKVVDEHWGIERHTHPLIELWFVISYVLSSVFSFVGRILLALLSRYRELAADRGAVRITGNAGELASALQKLYDATAARPPNDMRDAYEIPPERAIVPLSMATDVEVPNSNDADTPWFETHPSLETRLGRLREAEAAFETASSSGSPEN